MLLSIGALVGVVSVAAIGVTASGAFTGSPTVHLPVGTASCGGSLVGLRAGSSQPDALGAAAMLSEADLTINADSVIATFVVAGQIPDGASLKPTEVFDWGVKIRGANGSLYSLAAMVGAGPYGRSNLKGGATEVLPSERKVPSTMTTSADRITITAPVQAFDHLTPPLTFSAGYGETYGPDFSSVMQSCPASGSDMLPFPAPAASAVAPGPTTSPTATQEPTTTSPSTTELQPTTGAAATTATSGGSQPTSTSRAAIGAAPPATAPAAETTLPTPPSPMWVYYTVDRVVAKLVEKIDPRLTTQYHQFVVDARCSYGTGDAAFHVGEGRYTCLAIAADGSTVGQFTIEVKATQLGNIEDPIVTIVALS